MKGVNFAMVQAAPMIPSPRVYTPDEANKKIREMVPEGLLLKAVYDPMTMMLMVYKMSDAVLDMLAKSKAVVMKRTSQKARRLNADFEKRMQEVEDGGVMRAFYEMYEAWYDECVSDMMNDWALSYHTAVMNATPYRGNVANLIGVILTTRAVALFCQRKDEELSEMVRACLSGTGLNWGYVDSPYSKDVVALLDEMLETLGVDPEVESKETRQWVKVFENRLNQMCIAIEEMPKEKKFELVND